MLIGCNLNTEYLENKPQYSLDYPIYTYASPNLAIAASPNEKKYMIAQV